MSRAARALGVAAGLVVMAGIARALLHVTPGLIGEYFTSTDRSGSPRFTAIDTSISTAQISSHWRDAPPDTFSVRWRGYLVVGRAGFYTFATSSDDGSWLYVDGQLIVDNGGSHSALTRTGRIRLDRGPHFVLVEYVQDGGPFSLDWRWAPDGASLTAVPVWLLSPRRVTYPIAVTAHIVEWLWWTSLAAVLVSLLIAIAPMQHRVPEGFLRHPKTASLLLFVVLAVIHTWPLARDPARLSRNDNADTVLNEWTLAWVAHQAPRDPLHLFDANIFFPERRTLAYSETMLVQASMAAPLLWLGASPVLAYNLILIAGFALTGWTMSLMLARWTGDWMAALTGGVLMGFNAHTLTRMPHLQAQHVEFLPLALLALDRVLVDARIRDALALAGWFVLQALASFYLMVLTAFALAAAIVVRPRDWIGKRSAPIAACIAVAAGAALAALLPFLLPYWHVHRDQGFSRGLDEVAGFAATWRDYLTTPGRIPRAFIARWGSANGLYPGALGCALAAIAIAGGTAIRDRRARMCLAFGVVGAVLSFGPQVPGYAAVYAIFPPLHGVRAVSRFGYLAIVAVAVLAAYGMVHVRARMRDRSGSAAVSLIILVLAAIEPLAAPITYTPVGDIPRIYDRIAQQPDIVIAELPLPPPRGIFLNAAAMRNSTRHWKRMLNGYSGFIPASYYNHYEKLGTFPELDAVAALRAFGVTHVVAHRGSLGQTRRAALDASAELRRIAEDGDIGLYEILPAAPSRP